jgi:NADH-quinone oxidoreductase subunit J
LEVSTAGGASEHSADGHGCVFHDGLSQAVSSFEFLVSGSEQADVITAVLFDSELESRNSELETNLRFTNLMSTILFILFAGLAIGSAIAMVSQRNPLYSAISLIGVFIALASIYVTLAAPFIAAVQVIVYAGAIMVLVIFVIMLLNVEQEEPRRRRLRFLVPAAIGMAAILIAETAFILYSVQTTPGQVSRGLSDVGLTYSIGEGLFTRYLLPFEITSILLLMAIVGAMSLARRTGFLSSTARVVPGSQVLAMDIVNPRAIGDQRPVETNTTDEAAHLLGVDRMRNREE